MKYIQYIFAVWSLILFSGCSDPAATSLPQREDYSNFQEFLTEVAQKADYCIELTSSPGALKIKTKSGKILNIKDKCPLFILGQDGMISRNGRSTRRPSVSADI